jgi:hypothetical protein
VLIDKEFFRFHPSSDSFAGICSGQHHLLISGERFPGVAKAFNDWAENFLNHIVHA